MSEIELATLIIGLLYAIAWVFSNFRILSSTMSNNCIYSMRNYHREGLYLVTEHCIYVIILFFGEQLLSSYSFINIDGDNSESKAIRQLFLVLVL